MNHALKSIVTATLLAMSVSAYAINESELPAKKHTDLKLYLTASEAYDMINKAPEKTLFIDVRTRAEVNFLGTATLIDANIPYMTPDSWTEWDDKKGHFKLAPNSGFLTAFEDRINEKGLDKNATIILMCRSGSRSSKATNLLKQAGYSKVYTVVDGYEGDKAKAGDKKGQRVVNGWRNNNLPWTYKLDKSKMYFDI